MKNKTKIYFIIIILFGNSFLAFSSECPPTPSDGPPLDNCLPIDQGEMIMLALGIILGIYLIKKHLQNTRAQH